MNASIRPSWRPRHSGLLPPLVSARSRLRSITTESTAAEAIPTEPLHRSRTISTLQNDHGHEEQRYTRVHGHDETGQHGENVLSGSGMASGTENEPSSHDVSDRDICVTPMSITGELSTVDVMIEPRPPGVVARVTASETFEAGLPTDGVSGGDAVLGISHQSGNANSRARLQSRRTPRAREPSARVRYGN